MQKKALEEGETEEKPSYPERPPSGKPISALRAAEIRLANMLANSTVEDKVVTDFRHAL